MSCMRTEDKGQHRQAKAEMQADRKERLKLQERELQERVKTNERLVARMTVLQRENGDLRRDYR